MPLNPIIKKSSIISIEHTYVASEPDDATCSLESIKESDAQFDSKMNILKRRPKPQRENIKFARTAEVYSLEICHSNSHNQTHASVMSADTTHACALSRVDRFFNDLNEYLAKNSQAKLTQEYCLNAAREMGLDLDNMLPDKYLDFVTELNNILDNFDYQKPFDDSDLVEEALRQNVISQEEIRSRQLSFRRSEGAYGRFNLGSTNTTSSFFSPKPPHHVQSLNLDVVRRKSSDARKKSPEERQFIPPTLVPCSPPPMPLLHSTESRGTQTHIILLASTAQNTDNENERISGLKP